MAEAALDEVRRAVAAIQEANFSTVEDLQRAKGKVNEALHAARQAGAGEADLLDAARPKTIAVDDAGSAGAAARKARKLRQLEKELQEREKQLKNEQDRVSRLAQASAARKAAKAEAKKAQEAKETKEAQEAKEVEEAREAKEAAAAAESGSQSPSNRAEGHGSRSRSGSRSRQAIASPSAAAAELASDVAASASAPAKEAAALVAPAANPTETARDTGLQLAVPKPQVEDLPTLSALLGKPQDPQPSGLFGTPPPSSSQQPMDLAHMPLSMIAMYAPASHGAKRLGSNDLSTGGGEICHNYAMGKCSRWSCKFKHIR